MKIKKKSDGLIIASINILLVICIIAIFLLYNSNAQNKIKEQNIDDIKNINQSSANISSMFFKNQQREISDMVSYITLHKFTYTEALSFICDSHGDIKNKYELVGTDGRGYAALRDKKGFVPVDYTSTSYKYFNVIFRNYTIADGMYTPEFTDSYTANRSFALHAHLKLLDDTGKIGTYTLLAVSQSRDFSGLIELNGGYTGMSTVFIDRTGAYVISSSEFKNDNLFQYFTEYNELSLEKRNELIDKLAGSIRGEYFFKNSKDQECIFVYTAVPNTNWYCVSCVPIASFKQTQMDLQFVLWITFLLLCLMFFDILWLNHINQQLKISVQNEKKAGEAKTEFLSRMSHDIRTPLNVIIGMTMLAQREENPPATKKDLENITQSGKFLLSLVNDILDLNKVESGKMELHLAPYSFAEFTSSMNAMIGPLCADKKITLELTRCKGDDVYLLDAMRVNQIFFNILSNSVKFTAPGGNIKLVCTEEAITGDESVISFIASDNGIGMSEEFQKHMFEAFTQEEHEFRSTAQGTGLGLAIVKRLVDLMGGTISVKSTLDVGTTFFVTLPAKKVKELSIKEKKHEVASSSLSGKKILLFEDNELNAEIAGTLLSDKGIIVEYAQNGKVGLDKFSASSVNYYDAMLMDLRMPVMDGLEATKAIRSLERSDAKTIPIIAMTANAYDVDVQNCFDVGMNAHLAKPINPDELFSVLANTLQEKFVDN